MELQALTSLGSTAAGLPLRIGTVLKKLFRLSALVIAAAAILWFTREYLLPKPRVADEEHPHFRSTPPAPPVEHEDLTAIKGIGPVYAARLADAGIRSFRSLAEVDAATIATAVGTTEQAVDSWITQAKARLS